MYYIFKFRFFPGSGFKISFSCAIKANTVKRRHAPFFTQGSDRFHVKSGNLEFRYTRYPWLHRFRVFVFYSIWSARWYCDGISSLTTSRPLASSIADLFFIAKCRQLNFHRYPQGFEHFTTPPEHLEKRAKGAGSSSSQGWSLYMHVLRSYRFNDLFSNNCYRIWIEKIRRNRNLQSQHA